MTGVLAKNLSGMDVMGADGVEIGELYNVTMDIRTGQLFDIIVEPNDGINPAALDFETDDEGRVHIPIEDVQAVKDHIVVQS